MESKKRPRVRRAGFELRAPPSWLDAAVAALATQDRRPASFNPRLRAPPFFLPMARTSLFFSPQGDSITVSKAIFSFSPFHQGVCGYFRTGRSKMVPLSGTEGRKERSILEWLHPPFPFAEASTQ